MMSKPIIAVDIDDVLLQHFADLIAWYNKHYDTSLTLAHNNGLDPKPWGTDDVVEAIRRVHEFFDTPEFRNAKPYPESVQAISQLSERYQLIALSARDLMIEQFTRGWLEQYFSGKFSDAQFTAKYSLAARARSKTDVLLEMGASYLIDDTPDTLIKAARANIKGLLFGEYPWNQAIELPDTIVRCKDWAAVREYFDGQ